MENNCPRCGRSIDIQDQVGYCPFCGANIDETVTAEEFDRYSPWDDRENLGFLRALIDTWKESVFHPAKYFSTMPVTGGYGGPLLYGFIVGEVAFLFSLFWQVIFMMMGTLGESYEQFEAMGLSVSAMVMLAIFSPLLVIIGYFVSAAILHICLLIVGGVRRDFEATFRVVCYAAGANVFNMLPFCGSLVAWILNAVLVVIGIREAHETSSGKAFLAYFLPVFLCCGLLALGLLLAAPDMSKFFEGWAP